MSAVIRFFAASSRVVGFDPRAGSAGFGAPGAGDVVALCYVQPRPQTYARYVARRLRRLAPEARLMLVALNTVDEAEDLDRLAAGTTIDAVALSLAVAVQRVEGWHAIPPARPEMDGGLSPAVA